jgi:hypothetical protein
MTSLTQTERRTLKLMTNLAIRWEGTLAASQGNGDYAISRDQRREIERCRRNIAKFEALLAKLLRLPVG